MARFVTFNGLTLVHPGAISRVDINELAQVGPGAIGVIGVIGEAEGGEPDVAYVLDDPSQAKNLFRDGPLADAMRLFFSPSSDPRVPGGATRVIGIKPNQSTQSEDTLTGQLAQGTAGENQAVLTSRDYGRHTENLTWSFVRDPIDSTKFQVTIGEVGSSNQEEILDIGGVPLMNLVFKGPEEEIVVYTGTAEAGSTAFVINDSSLPATGVNAGMFVRIIDSSDNDLDGEIRRITGFTGSTNITVSDSEAGAGFGNAGATAVPTGTTYEIVRTRVATLAVKSATNTSPNATITFDSDVYKESTTSVSDLDGTTIRVVSGNGQGQIRKIKSAALAAGAGSDVVITLADDDLFDTAPVVDDQIAIIDVSTATATITGSNGAATSLDTTVDFGESDDPADATGPAADLSITLSSTKSVADIVAEINATLAEATQPTAGSNYLASVGPGRTGSTVVGSSQLFDFDSENLAIDLMADTDLDPNNRNRLRDNLNQLIDAVNTFSSRFSLARSDSGSTASDTGAGIPLFFTTDVPLQVSGGTRGASTNSNWQDAFDELLKHQVDLVVPLISSDLSDDIFSSTATVDAVHAQLVSHLDTAKGIGRSEREGFAALEVSGSGALTAILAKAAALNNVNCSVLFQKPQVLDVDGNLEIMPPWAHACIAAGMAAGLPFGEALTYKILRVNSVEDPTNIDTLDRTTANQLQLGGVLFSEYIRGKGHRWVRDITTWLSDDNTANTNRPVRRVLNYVSRTVRTNVEDRFTGTRGVPGTVSGIKSYVEQQLENFRRDGIIVDSQDAETGETVRAYTSPTVTLASDVATIKFKVYPVHDINYQLIEIFAQMPVLSA